MLEKALLIALVSVAVIAGANAIPDILGQVADAMDVLDKVECPKSQPKCKDD